MMIDRSPGSLLGIRIAACNISISCVSDWLCFICWVGVNWMDYGFPDISGIIRWSWNYFSMAWDYFWWIFCELFWGGKYFAGVCWRTSQFWVCPEIEEVLPKFLQNYIFINFETGFRK
ncbi:uncharacterized protein M6B38_205445 [Iris pallida]|uniref:Uncharacterized protein n=1 Tax=Iris pallida TaxID=29817 RepID=A0AAX6E7N4_IRIPA|nr:uncharacterized protein M6B38_205445 [Iris pallida]